MSLIIHTGITKDFFWTRLILRLISMFLVDGDVGYVCFTASIAGQQTDSQRSAKRRPQKFRRFESGHRYSAAVSSSISHPGLDLMTYRP
jgi:hypothetical protein